MMKESLFVAALIGFAVSAHGDRATALRLVPFPKEVTVNVGQFRLLELVLEVPPGTTDTLGHSISEELLRAGFRLPEIREFSGPEQIFRLSAKGDGELPRPAFREGATDQDYTLEVDEDTVIGAAPGEEGLFYAAQTLRQLIRANSEINDHVPARPALPSVSIRDWPSLEWRMFQDDMTRGPSATLGTLKRMVDTASTLKMNGFALHIEHQYAFKKHPTIGPQFGSLTPEDLTELVAYAKPRSMNILGMQQSFGHMRSILTYNPNYAHLQETWDVLTPAKEETYAFLDDLYSEVIPLLPFPWFNICSDEVEGLGTGPAKEMVEEQGVGGVYVYHIRRLHDLLKNKYGKRMMVWGDIIKKFPEHLGEMPTDTIMLSWGYFPKDSYDEDIRPFAESGYDFLVCPSVMEHSRFLPNTALSTMNIRNYVRDGAKNGALGMLNTEWKDDGQTLHHAAWYSYAWGAECAWNASTTPLEDFNRRVGAVLFGEAGDHFAQAIQLLNKTFTITEPKRLEGLINKRLYWHNDFATEGDRNAIRSGGEKLRTLASEAIVHLEACRDDAMVNRDYIDPVLSGARRIQFVGQRMMDGLQAIDLYAEAVQSNDSEEQIRKLSLVEDLVRRTRDQQAELGREFIRIWLRQARLYALDLTTRRYEEVARDYEYLLARLSAAKKSAEKGQPLPSPEEMGLYITPET